MIQEDPTCHRATKPLHGNCWALEPGATSTEPTTTTTEAWAPEGSHCSEMSQQPPLTQREAHAAVKTQHSQKQTKI